MSGPTGYADGPSVSKSSHLNRSPCHSPTQDTLVERKHLVFKKIKQEPLFLFDVWCRGAGQEKGQEEGEVGGGGRHEDSI